MAEIKDSGTRREFDSGAVRDVQEGKGRCDLLPLDVVSSLLGGYYSTNKNICLPTDEVLEFINLYVRNGDTGHLLTAIYKFCTERNIHPCTAILEVAIHYEDGARKYQERNWEKGIPLHCYIDSGVRHYLKHIRGDRDEPHDRAFLWNMLGAIWTHNHKPELIDLPFNSNLKTTFGSDDVATGSDSKSIGVAERAKKFRETSFA